LADAFAAALADARATILAAALALLSAITAAAAASSSLSEGKLDAAMFASTTPCANNDYSIEIGDGTMHHVSSVLKT
jgi:hypothetical protein